MVTTRSGAWDDVAVADNEAMAESFRAQKARSLQEQSARETADSFLPSCLCDSSRRGAMLKIDPMANCLIQRYVASLLELPGIHPVRAAHATVPCLTRTAPPDARNSCFGALLAS